MPTARCEWTEESQRCRDVAEYVTDCGNMLLCRGHAAIVTMNNGQGAVRDFDANRDLFVVYVVYRSPSDCPGEYVGRRQYVGPAGQLYVDANLFGRGPTAESVRERLPPGLTRLQREPDDDPCIVETWI